MFGFIKRLFNQGPEVDFRALIADGAEIIDVRSPQEFSSGHIKGARNLPLGNLEAQLKSLDKNKTYILCCASGMRSGSAKSYLSSKGFTQVYNAGSWRRLMP